MKQEKNSLIAAALSMLVLVGWFYFFAPKPEPNAPQTEGAAPAAVAALTTATETASAPALPPSSSSVPAGPERLIEKETPLLSMVWTNRGGRLSKIQLKNYHEDVKKESPPINLLALQGEKSASLLCKDCNLPLPDDVRYESVPMQGQGIAFQAEEGGLVVRKVYDWSPDQYLFNLTVTVENKSDREFQGRLGLGWTAGQIPEKPKGPLGFLKGPDDRKGFLYLLGKGVERFTEAEKSLELSGPITWAGIEDRYFLVALISRRLSSDDSLKLEQPRLEQVGDRLALSLFPAAVTIPSQGRHEEKYSFYVGPKKRNSLKLAGVGLEDAIDYGWFWFLAIPILELLRIFHTGVGNWGLAVILLTLFAKLLLNPLTVRSMKQMKGMQALQPMLAALKEKYKDDKQRLNTETMALFRTHKVNPMGGCLPVILQMPIYIALYKVLYSAIELYHAPFIGFYRDLSAPDPYFILPVLLGVAMVAQQKLTPSASADPVQKQMMMFMPIMFTAFMLFLPMGLVLYIFVNTLFSVIQQWMYQGGLKWRDVLRGNFKAQAGA